MHVRAWRVFGYKKATMGEVIVGTVMAVWLTRKVRRKTARGTKPSGDDRDCSVAP